MKPEPLVVVSILNWNQFNLTINCLKSLSEQNHSELIVCVTDNHSISFDEQQLLRLFPGITLFKHTENMGYAAGHLSALDYAIELNAELFWILNNDTVFTDSTLPTLIDAFNNAGEALYGSLGVNTDGSITPENIWGIESNNDGLACTFVPLSEERLLEEPVQQVANLLGCSLLIPLSIIKRYGFIDSSFFLYFEETDYCLKLLQKNVPSYLVSTSRIVHKQKASTEFNPNLTKMMDYYLYRNLHRVIKTHAPKMLSVHYVKSIAKRFVFANMMKKAHFVKVNSFQILGVLHAYIGIKGKYYDPEAFLDDS